jgi:hypothetical protein
LALAVLVTAIAALAYLVFEVKPVVIETVRDPVQMPHPTKAPHA